MLTHLHIRNFTIIDSVELELDAGMTALTGETGAGKSILLDAIGLVLGGRSDAGSVRPGVERAEISASFQPDPDSPLWPWLRDNDLDDENQCQVRRIVAATGKSRGYINGQPVSMQTLRTAGEMLVEIHGQHEHYALTSRSTQRELLDSMSGNPRLCNQVAEYHANWQALTQRIVELGNRGEQREQRIAMLQFQIDEFNALSINADEVGSIESEHHRLSNAGQLLQHAREALSALEDSEHSADSQLNSALRQLQQLQAVDASIADSLEVVNTASILTSEAANSVRAYINQIDIDDSLLQHLDERLATLHRMAKKHRTDINGLLDVQAGLERSLAELNGHENDIEALQKEATSLYEVYLAQAKKLSRLRKKTAKELSASVSSGMSALGMQGGTFVCEVNQANNEKVEPGRHGLDEIRFLVSPNPGMQAGDISKIASGGELSRLSLAIALVATRNKRFPTRIFDEVDSGIGGSVAETVGQYLRELGTRAQVLCVTHLPQVAAQAHQHIRVSKQVTDGQTTTNLATLDRKQTVDEIARMLGGAKVTRKSLQHAREMLDTANV